MQVASRVFLLNNTDICSFVQYNSNAQILLVFISWIKSRYLRSLKTDY